MLSSPSVRPRDAVAVVVPTLNSARTLTACLESIRRQTTSCVSVVVDNHSTDDTPEIARRLADIIIIAGPERSRQRNVGIAATRSDVIAIIDSDMVLEPTVIEDAVTALTAGAGSVVIPERTVGQGFWAAVRQFERSFYVGDEAVEAARVFRRDVLDRTGGFDEGLTGAEDWDLTIRALEFGPVGRTSAYISHDEGRVRYLSACKKKAYYAVGVRRFWRKHGTTVALRAAGRPYLRRPWLLVAPHPLLGAGLVALKVGETTAMAWRLLTDSA